MYVVKERRRNEAKVDEAKVDEAKSTEQSRRSKSRRSKSRRRKVATMISGIIIILYCFVITGRMSHELNTRWSIAEDMNHAIDLPHKQKSAEARVNGINKNMQQRDTSAEKQQSSWWRGQAHVSNATHPHLGARLQKGERSIYQMIVDPSTDRLTVPDTNNSFGINPNVLCPNQAYGIEQESGNQVLQKVKRGIDKYNNRTPTRKSKILCMVYTVDLPESRANLKAQVETWASKCDGFWAASNNTNHTIGSIDLVHEGPESYDVMWQKIRAMWAYAYDHYRDEYDFFHICGDDIYIAVENLRAFLDGPYVLKLENGYLDEISGSPDYRREAEKWLDGGEYREQHGISTGRPLYFATPCKHRKTMFPCGGPGYTLNRAALEVFGKLQIDLPFAHLMDSREDLLIGSSFQNVGIEVSHVFDPGNGMRYGQSAAFSYQKYGDHVGSPGLKRVVKKYRLIPGDYLDGISEEMAVLHLKFDKEFLKENGSTIAELLYRYHAILYDLCSKEDLRNL